MQTSPSAPANGALRGYAPLLLSLLFVGGCGGGSSTSTAGASRGIGQLQVTVIWPPYQPSTPTAQSKGTFGQRAAQVSRFIAPNATLVRITVTVGTGPKDKQTADVMRPSTDSTSTYTFSGLPTGTLAVLVEEFDTTSANPNVAVASGADSITITTGNDANHPAMLTVQPNTEVDHVDISGPTTLGVGATGVVTASARNKTGGLVPIPAGALAFDSTLKNFATVDAQGNVKALAYGATDITATVSLSGASPTPPGTLRLQVNVTAANITITPNEVTLGVGTTQTFTAKVDGDNGTGVTWSVVEPGGGTINPTTGDYTAPNTRSTFHVRATSNTDKTTFADATVHVSSGNVDVNVN